MTNFVISILDVKPLFLPQKSRGGVQAQLYLNHVLMTGGAQGKDAVADNEAKTK